MTGIAGTSFARTRMVLLRRAGPRFLPATSVARFARARAADCRTHEIETSQARAPDGSGITATMAIEPTAQLQFATPHQGLLRERPGPGAARPRRGQTFSRPGSSPGRTRDTRLRHGQSMAPIWTEVPMGAAGTGCEARIRRRGPARRRLIQATEGAQAIWPRRPHQPESIQARPHRAPTPVSGHARLAGEPVRGGGSPPPADAPVTARTDAAINRSAIDAQRLDQRHAPGLTRCTRIARDARRRSDACTRFCCARPGSTCGGGRRR